MLEAAFWGLTLPGSQRQVGLVMAFGAGVLITALAFVLTEEALRRGGIETVAVGMAGGPIAFVRLGDRPPQAVPPPISPPPPLLRTRDAGVVLGVSP